MIVEKRGSFLEASDKEKSERVLILTCGDDGMSRSPDFYNFTKRYPLDKDDIKLIKSIKIEKQNLGLESNSYVAPMSKSSYPFKFLFLLVTKKEGLSVPEPYMYDAINELILLCKIRGFKKFIMPRLGIGDGLSWDFIKSTFDSLYKETFKEEADIIVYYQL